LPKNRGGASFSWQIMRGDRTGCHLFHLIDGGIDTGDIVMARPYTFPASCRTPAEYRAYHLATERKFFTDVIKKVRTNASFVLKKQDEAVSTYFPRLATDEHGWVDWSWGAGDIARFIAAFDRPYGGASTMLNGRRVRLRLATVARRDGIFHPFMSGLVYRKHAGAIWVAAHDGSVVVREILEHNGDSCDTRVGHRLMTPREHLDTARAYTALYDAKGLRPSS
jgi:methionyl-tRNA formyltransferase